MDKKGFLNDKEIMKLFRIIRILFFSNIQNQVNTFKSSHHIKMWKVNCDFFSF
jgi:hypothetical protein